MKKLSKYRTRHIKKKGIPFEIRIGTCDENVLDEVISGDCYKLEQINLRRNPNIIDVGGHIGAFTKYCAWKWPHCEIHSEGSFVFRQTEKGRKQHVKSESTY